MKETGAIPAEIASLSFEEALQALEAIVRRLDSGQGGLEQAIEDYARGTALRQHCEKKLEDARMRVEKVVQQADGSVKTEPLDGQS